MGKSYLQICKVKQLFIHGMIFSCCIFNVYCGLMTKLWKFEGLQKTVKTVE